MYSIHMSKIEYKICYKWRIHHPYLLPIHFMVHNILHMNNKMNKIIITFFAVEDVTNRLELSLLDGEFLCISSTFLLSLLSETSSTFFPQFPPLHRIINLWVYDIPLSLRGIENRSMFICWENNVLQQRSQVHRRSNGEKMNSCFVGCAIYRISEKWT